MLETHWNIIFRDNGGELSPGLSLSKTGLIQWSDRSYTGIRHTIPKRFQYDSNDYDRFLFDFGEEGVEPQVVFIMI